MSGSFYQGWPEHRLVKARIWVLGTIANLEAIRDSAALAGKEGLIEDVYSGADELSDLISDWRGELSLIEEEIESPTPQRYPPRRQHLVRELVRES